MKHGLDSGLKQTSTIMAFQSLLVVLHLSWNSSFVFLLLISIVFFYSQPLSVALYSFFSLSKINFNVGLFSKFFSRTTCQLHLVFVQCLCVTNVQLSHSHSHPYDFITIATHTPRGFLFFVKVLMFQLLIIWTSFCCRCPSTWLFSSWISCHTLHALIVLPIVIWRIWIGGRIWKQNTYCILRRLHIFEKKEKPRKIKKTTQ